LLGLQSGQEHTQMKYQQMDTHLNQQLPKCYIPSPATEPSASTQSEVDSVLSKMNKCGKKVGNFAHAFREHVRLGHNITETVKGKLWMGAKILIVGGLEKLFKKLFSVSEGEKLLKTSQCYLSTTTGAIAGLLFISTNSISFWSERSIKVPSPNGGMVRLHYKVLIPLKKIRAISLCENVNKPSSKYIQITTCDNFDFWFMGFLDYQKALKYLQPAISQA